MSEHSGASRAARTQLSMAGVIVDIQGNEIPVVVMDLSAGGFQLRSTDPLDVGEQIGLRCGRGPIQPAEIRWVRGLEAGGMFLARPEEPA